MAKYFNHLTRALPVHLTDGSLKVLAPKTYTEIPDSLAGSSEIQQAQAAKKISMAPRVPEPAPPKPVVKVDPPAPAKAPEKKVTSPAKEAKSEVLSAHKTSDKVSTASQESGSSQGEDSSVDEAGAAPAKQSKSSRRSSKASSTSKASKGSGKKKTSK